ncbi:RelA/SpoT domain-containing protein [Burkholderia cepacia]|uniref:RelA/SpoT domain-containing protein n=1 Tax=Burkholderia cepacia TaxID=292 RepID=UPI001CF5519C|nr:RelA/SpoT domain-containing protein [Burkholderia cepacia]MCA7898228.1 RelA/SpoT domain-containing protein [Burkholderia cepacia]
MKPVAWQIQCERPKARPACVRLSIFELKSSSLPHTDNSNYSKAFRGYMTNGSPTLVLKEGTHEAFLTRNRLNKEMWERSGCIWADLQDVAHDHESNLDALATSAEFFAKTIQRFERVHSVRWRVKDTEHLLEKIVRKRADETSAAKYASINVSNYFELVTDLVGIRALHLFKDDCLAIHESLMKTWTPIEEPIAYTREGDHEAFKERLATVGLLSKDHPAGYRSLHYVVESRPTQRIIRAEIQVRTLFEEGWSEIDHTVRYPNFSNDKLIGYLLKIFNRMAGSADEMGGFVRDLNLVLQERERELLEAMTTKEDALAQVEGTLAELEELKDTNAESASLIKKLRADVRKLEGTTTTPALSNWQAASASRNLSELLQWRSDAKLQETLKLIEQANEPYARVRAALDKRNNIIEAAILKSRGKNTDKK